jgi:hypothetical protein
MWCRNLSLLWWQWAEGMDTYPYPGCGGGKGGYLSLSWWGWGKGWIPIPFLVVVGEGVDTYPYPSGSGEGGGLLLWKEAMAAMTALIYFYTTGSFYCWELYTVHVHKQRLWRCCMPVQQHGNWSSQDAPRLASRCLVSSRFVWPGLSSDST